MAFKLTSSAFNSGDSIPTKYACDGEIFSPPLSWERLPGDTQSLVLIVDDPDAPNGTFTHWVLYNILPEVVRLPENFSSSNERFTQGRNSRENTRYDGPCPP